MADTIIPQKQCSTCKQYFLPTLEHFHKCRSHKDGLSSRCKICARAIAEQYHTDNRDVVNEKQRQKGVESRKRNKVKRQEYEQRPEVKTRRLVLKAEWEKNNPDKVKDSRKKTRIKSREKRRIALKDWRERNPDKVKAQSDRSKRDPIKRRAQEHSRRVRKNNGGGEFSKSDVLLQYKSQKGLCWWCGKPVGDDYHIDHRVALVRGGSNAANNIVISCPHCNLSKHDKFPHEWNGRLL